MLTVLIAAKQKYCEHSNAAVHSSLCDHNVYFLVWIGGYFSLFIHFFVHVMFNAYTLHMLSIGS